MTPLAGPVHAIAATVAAAGVAKLLRPTGTAVALRALGLPGRRRAVYALGIAELVIAAIVLAGVGAPAVAALAVLHVGFAVAAVVLRRRAADCGCFGRGAPVTGIHVAVTAVAAAVAAVAVGADVPSLGAAVGDTPAAGIPYAALVGLLAAAEVLCLTVLAELQAAMEPLRA